MDEADPEHPESEWLEEEVQTTEVYHNTRS